MPHEDRFEEFQACAIEIVQKELADAAIQRKLNTPPEHVKYWYIVNERGEFWTTGYGWGGKIGADRFADPKDINGLPVDGRGSLVWCR
jgi:hypothetical protein